MLLYGAAHANRARLLSLMMNKAIVVNKRNILGGYAHLNRRPELTVISTIGAVILRPLSQCTGEADGAVAYCGLFWLLAN